MHTMPNTANSPMSSNVEAARPIGNTSRNARQPASVTHLTNSPVHESTGTNRLRPRTPHDSEQPEPHDPRELGSPERKGDDERGRHDATRRRVATTSLRGRPSVTVSGSSLQTGAGRDDRPHIVRSSAMPKSPCGRHRITRIINTSGIASRYALEM